MLEQLYIACKIGDIKQTKTAIDLFFRTKLLAEMQTSNLDPAYDLNRSIPDPGSKNKHTPLTIAAIYGQNQCLEELIRPYKRLGSKRIVNLDQLDGIGFSALMHAAYLGQTT